MTCREKLKIEHPDDVNEDYCGGCWGCPSDYGYADRPGYCDKGLEYSNCEMCWDRWIPEEKTICSCYHEQDQRCNGTRERDLCSCKGDESKCDYYPEKREKAELQNIPGMIYAEVPKLTKLTKPQTEQPRILDSGTRRKFESGAVRDIQEGKGRCDLLPLDVMALMYSGDTGVVFAGIADFIAFHGDWTCLTGALEYAEKHMFADRSTMLLEVSKHFEEGCKKYGENNWRKGIPTHCYINSAVRHFLKFLRGDQDEPHDRAFVWNILCCIWTCKHKPELNDYAKTEASDGNSI